MKKMMSTHYSQAGFNWAMLVLRITFGMLMIVNHGLSKLMKFSGMKGTFYSFWGLSSSTSLGLAVFAEVFCSALIVLGFLTRVAILPLIVTMLVAYFGVHAAGDFSKAEGSLTYLAVYIVILFCGAGKISIDGMVGKK
jgi:putative oxidoreductase